MKKPSAIVILILLSFLPCLAQTRQAPVPVCRAATFTVFKSLPELSYECPEGLNDSDDKILTLPDRLTTLSDAEKELESFTSAAWWSADVDELTACGIHGKAGSLSAEEKEKYRGGEYWFGLFGNNSLRLVLLKDPCYQTGYSGSVAFLLYRKGGKVAVTRVIDGYYSRIENSIGIDFANVNGQQIIEVSTANNMPPAVLNYYFAIDQKTGKAVPKSLFKEQGILTNEIRSAMIIGDASEWGLPRGAREMEVIRQQRFLPSFTSYSYMYVDGIDHKLARRGYRWNGKYYVAGRVH
jgi:hypothetical protein